MGQQPTETLEMERKESCTWLIHYQDKSSLYPASQGS